MLRASTQIGEANSWTMHSGSGNSRFKSLMIGQGRLGNVLYVTKMVGHYPWPSRLDLSQNSRTGARSCSMASGGPTLSACQPAGSVARARAIAASHSP